MNYSTPLTVRTTYILECTNNGNPIFHFSLMAAKLTYSLDTDDILLVCK